MRLSRTKQETRVWTRSCRIAGERIALVPTMGYLHDGHLSLIERARASADRVVVSIFVNPLQFGPNEDFERYPRDLNRDLDLCEKSGAHLAFSPSVEEMYPGGEPWTEVVPVQGADHLCGASRPGHFAGVLTVVAKLFGIVRPDVAVFGQKDFQQLVLIRRMAADLDLEIEVVGAPIVREPDGLAMSSRNSYLSPDERLRALALSRALARCQSLFGEGERNAAAFRGLLLDMDGEGVELEYGEVVDPETLEPLEEVRQGAVCAVAARVGRTRLIDNTILSN
jgi:pantoate--beta-alanine ligase